MPDGVARRLRGKDGTSPELTMVEKAREHISRTPRPSQELENLEQDIDAEVQQALSADIPLPPVEYLIAEERGLKTDEPEVREDNADTDIEALMEDQAEPEVAKSEKDYEIVTPDVSEEVNTDNANANEEEIVLDENEIVLSGAAYVNNEEGTQSIPQRHSDPMMMELHDTFFKDETVETDPEISLDSIREAIRSSEASQEAMALEDELPDDALQPLEQSELEAVSQSGASKNTLEEEQFEELGDEAEIEPLPAEDTLAASRVVIDSEPGLGLDEALKKLEQEERSGKF